MEKILDFIRNTKLKNKLIFAFLLMALIPFAIFSVFNVGSFIKQTQKNAMDHTSQMVGQVNNSIDTYIGSIDKMVNYISLSLRKSPVFDITTEDDENWAEETEEIEQRLQNIAASHHEVAGILLATKNDLYVSTGMSRVSKDPFANEKWYQDAIAAPDEIILVSKASGRNIVTNHDYSVDDVFSIAKAIRNPVGGEALGVILLDVRHDIIKNSINNITIGEKGFVFVTDSSNEVVYAPVNNVVYRINPKWLSLGEDQPVSANIRGEQYQIRYKQSDYTGWKTVGVFSVDEIMGAVTYVTYVFGLCIAVAMIVVIALSFRLANTITKPILKLKHLMKQAERGDLTVRFDSRYNDEVGELGLSFNHMIDQIDQLIHMVYVEQQNKREAELKSLQEQIKPHFLYNTLDTISWMARDYEADDIVRLVDALTSMFRIGLSHGKDIITLKEEITHVSNYLYIQKIRYKDKLNYTIEVSDQLYKYRVPKLIVQPLVENAIYHGIKAKRGGGIIHISAALRQDGKKLTISIHDNGAGIPPDKLEELNQRLSQRAAADENSSFGLFYIKERIKLSYGPEYGIHLESSLGEWTTVTLTLPADVNF
ncbi:sensor histidine kinase [Clostridiaceae bacterium NSJ-31]|uniref:histidine kinase n=1 Tax=Ligaoa zhengdingensis TaxID=2763658 RepID=A0A926E057_9FIRM|nr:sensor histidine kinase [Ligaoa zhengdingensis]